MHPIIDHLKIFRPIPEGLENRLATAFEIFDIRQSQFLLRVGEVPKHLFFIETGSFFVYRGAEKKPDIHGQKRQGDPMVNFEKFFYHLPSDENIICFQHARIYGLSFEEATLILKDYPDFEFYLYKIWGAPSKAIQTPEITQASNSFLFWEIGTKITRFISGKSA